jgi:hypothetical protein
MLLVVWPDELPGQHASVRFAAAETGFILSGLEENLPVILNNPKVEAPLGLRI